MTYDELYDKWAKAANLEKWEEKYNDLPEDKNIRIVTALMLENQRLIDNMHPEKAYPNSLELVKKVVPNLLAHKLVSVQPMLGPGGMVHYSRFKSVAEGAELKITLNMEQEDIAAKTRKLKANVKEDVDVLAKSIVAEINNEILNDLYNNAGTIAKLEKDDKESLYMCIHNVRNLIYRKTLRQSKYWMVISKDVNDRYSDTFKNIFHNVNLYVVDGWKENAMLVGSDREHPLDRPYFWCPYIMFTVMPGIVSDDLVTNEAFLIRYGKKLLREGAKAYAKITLPALPDEPFPTVLKAIARLMA